MSNHFSHPPSSDDDTHVEPSKTQIKKEMLALQNLGEQLITLSDAQLHELMLPERLLDALIMAKKLNNWGALKRQKQYIGRLMRDIDAAPIQHYLDTLRGVSIEHTAWLHRLEKTRENLLSDDKAFTVFIQSYPSTDIQTLRNLIRYTREERLKNKPPKHFRALFQLLKEIIPEPETIA